MGTYENSCWKKHGLHLRTAFCRFRANNPLANLPDWATPGCSELGPRPRALGTRRTWGFSGCHDEKKNFRKILRNSCFHYQKWWWFTKQSRCFRDYYPQCIDFNIKWCLPLNIRIFSETALEPEIIIADRTCSEQQLWWLCQESTGTAECQSATAK